MRIPIEGKQIAGAVCRVLAANFPHPIHKDTFDQDFAQPCFFVWISKTETSPVIWPRFEQYHTVEVRFYPQARETAHSECLEMTEKLHEALHAISIKTADGESLPIFATEATARMLDDCLSFSTRYRTEGYFDTPHIEEMQELAADVLAKP